MSYFKIRDLNLGRQILEKGKKCQKKEQGTQTRS